MSRIHTGTVEKRAEYCLYKHAVPMTVHEIATEIGYSHGYTREALREHRADDVIEGTKTDPVIACSVHGETVVLTSSYKGMIDSLEEASEDLAEKAKAEIPTGNVEKLQAYIRRHAESTFEIERRWEFWYPTATPPTGTSSPAVADD
jgi:hypothetical protein